MLKLPEILDIPPKLLPVIYNLNNFRYFLIDGGRGGGKSQSIARIILWISEQRKVRVCCGREIQKTINESVKTIFSDLIQKYNLNFTDGSDKILHNKTLSNFVFKGFREQGRVNIKGLEGVDILWIDEAEAITKSTLDVIIPTIRKNNSLVFFSLNRFTRNDPVYSAFINDPDCLHIKINYDENPYCPEILKKEADKCKKRSLADYNHIWLGMPLDQTKNALLSVNKIDEAKKISLYSENLISKSSVLSVDVAGSGGDMNVAKYICQKNSTQWADEYTYDWSEPDTDITIGKIISLASKLKPDILIIDADGVGYAIAVSVQKTVKNTIAFRGAGKVLNPKNNAANRRAEAYLDLREFVNNSFLKITHEKTLSQLEYINTIYKRNGLIYIQSKDEIREEQKESPDYADSLAMGIFAINHYQHLFNSDDKKETVVETDFDPFEM